MVLRPIICTVILIANCIFWFSYVLPRIKGLEKKIEQNEGLQSQNESFMKNEYNKYYWPSKGCSIVALLGLVFCGMNLYEDVLVIVFIALAAISVPLCLKLVGYYKRLQEKYKLDVRTSSEGRLYLRGDEVFDGVVSLGLAVYMLVLFLIQHVF